MTTWAIEASIDGGQREGRITMYLVVDDAKQDLLGEMAKHGPVMEFTARRYQPEDLAKAAFQSTERMRPGRDGGPPR